MRRTERAPWQQEQRSAVLRGLGARSHERGGGESGGHANSDAAGTSCNESCACPGLELAQGQRDVNFILFGGSCTRQKGFGRPGRADAALPAAADFPHHHGGGGAACSSRKAGGCLHVPSDVLPSEGSVSHLLVLARLLGSCLAGTSQEGARYLRPCPRAVTALLAARPRGLRLPGPWRRQAGCQSHPVNWLQLC